MPFGATLPYSHARLVQATAFFTALSRENLPKGHDFVAVLIIDTSGALTKKLAIRQTG
jgi:hypothetical protein